MMRTPTVVPPAAAPAASPVAAMPDRVTIYEVGPRDGLQNEKGLVPTEVKAEFMRRAGKLNPFEDIKREDAEHVMAALTSLDKDHWAEEWSKIGLGYEAKGDAAAKAGVAGMTRSLAREPRPPTMPTPGLGASVPCCVELLAELPADGTDGRPGAQRRALVDELVGWRPASPGTAAAMSRGIPGSRRSSAGGRCFVHHQAATPDSLR